jgi:hypothetical protein
MIVRVNFDRPVLIGLAERMHLFEASSGWIITEVEPGRIALSDGKGSIIVQDVPYVLHIVDAEEFVKDPRVQVSPTKHGRRKP